MQLNEKTKNLLSLLLRIVLSTGLLIFLFRRIDFKEVIAALRSANLNFIIWGIVVYFITNILILLRWFVLIKGLSLQAPFKSVMRFFFIGLFGNLFLPTAVGGDIIKTIGLCMQSSEKAKVVASVVLDRLVGFAGIVMMATVAFILGFHLINDLSILLSIIILAALSITIFVVLFNERIYAFCCQIFSFFPKIRQSLMRMHYDIVLIKDNKKSLLKALGLSLVSQLWLALTFLCIAKGFNQNIGIIYFLIFVPLICVSASLPSIGGLGVREAGVVYLLAKINVESSIAMSISLMSFVFMILVGLIGGVVYVVTLPARRL